MRRNLVAAAAIAMLISACSSGGDEVTEQILEGQEGVGDVEITDDGATIEVEGEDGGTVSIGSGEIPDDFPVPVPSGGDVTFTAFSDEGSMVNLVYSGDQLEALVSEYESWMESEGFEVTRSDTTSGDIRFVALVGSRASGSPTDVSISVSDDGTGGVSVIINTGP